MASPVGGVKVQPAWGKTVWGVNVGYPRQNPRQQLLEKTLNIGFFIHNINKVYIPKYQSL
jgi:hypothetical protein